MFSSNSFWRATTALAIVLLSPMSTEALSQRSPESTIVSSAAVADYSSVLDLPSAVIDVQGTSIRVAPQVAIPTQEERMRSTWTRQENYLAATKDPFAPFRVGIWTTMGVTSVASLVIDVLDDRSFLNGFASLCMLGLMVFLIGWEDVFQKRLEELTRKELANPFLKGNSGFFMKHTKVLDKTLFGNWKW